MAMLSPSILAADFSVLGEQVGIVENAGTDLLHIDVMDGMFVPNISIGFPVMSSLRPRTKLPFDVHLMIEKPENHIATAAKSGADYISVHAEACTHLHRIIGNIHEIGCKAGVALNPATPLCVLEDIIDDIDLIVIMTVNPGFGGQKFITSMLKKVRRCREMADNSSSKPLIELDGGVTLDNAQDCLEVGADILVAGSAVFKGDIADNVRRFKEKLAQ